MIVAKEGFIKLPHGVSLCQYKYHSCTQFMREFIREIPDGACFFVAKEKQIPLIAKPH